MNRMAEEKSDPQPSSSTRQALSTYRAPIIQSGGNAASAPVRLRPPTAAEFVAPPLPMSEREKLERHLNQERREQKGDLVLSSDDEEPEREVPQEITRDPHQEALHSWIQKAAHLQTRDQALLSDLLEELKRYPPINGQYTTSRSRLLHSHAIRTANHLAEREQELERVSQQLGRYWNNIPEAPSSRSYANPVPRVPETASALSSNDYSHTITARDPLHLPNRTGSVSESQTSTSAPALSSDSFQRPGQSSFTVPVQTSDGQFNPLLPPTAGSRNFHHHPSLGLVPGPDTFLSQYDQAVDQIRRTFGK